MPPRLTEESPTSGSVAERVQSILATKDLSLYRVSQLSEALYGRSSPYFVPHNLYYDLRSDRFRPSVHQIFSFSRLSGYSFPDWLRVFDFDLENITRAQVLLPSKRTILLDTSRIDRSAWIPWVRNRATLTPIPSIAPLAQFLELTAPKRMSSVLKSKRRFFYAKVGREDAFAFPDLVPGSIVRVNPEIAPTVLHQKNSQMSDRLFLVEHSKGFCCCRLRFLANNIIAPVDNGLSYAQVELDCPRDARIWGVVDLELRPLLHLEEAHVPKDLARRWKPQPLVEERGFGQLLRATRSRRRLSTREAAEMTRTIARFMKDERYICSSSSLSDYELRATPPRDFHKIMSLCSIYGLRFETAMAEIGVDVAVPSGEPLPDRFVFRGEAPSAPGRLDQAGRAGFFEKLLDDCQNEIPFFLRNLWEYFAGSAHISLDDFFWIGGDRDALHPYLANGLLVLVNRRRKTPFHLESKPVWQQPIYVVLTRGGTYQAACCGIENDKLVIHRYGEDFHTTTEYRHHRDADVVGQVIAVARRLL